MYIPPPPILLPSLPAGFLGEKIGREGQRKALRYESPEKGLAKRSVLFAPVCSIVFSIVAGVSGECFQSVT